MSGAVTPRRRRRHPRRLAGARRAAQNPDRTRRRAGRPVPAREAAARPAPMGRAARIRTLQASETARVRHAADAAKIADLLEIESRLSDVRGQIEQLTAQQKNLENQAAYGTLAVTFGTEVAAVQKAAAQWDPKTE